MSKLSTASADSDSPKDPLAPRGPTTCTIDMAVLRRMNMKELHNLRDRLHTLVDVVAAFSCQPCFASEDGMAFNDAGKALEQVLTFLGGYEQAIVNVATASQSTDADDVEWRSWTILGFEAGMTDDLADLAVLAAEAMRDKAEAKRRRRTVENFPQRLDASRQDEGDINETAEIMSLWGALSPTDQKDALSFARALSGDASRTRPSGGDAAP